MSTGEEIKRIKKKSQKFLVCKTLERLLTEIKILVHKKAYTQMFTAALLRIAKNWK